MKTLFVLLLVLPLGAWAGDPPEGPPPGPHEMICGQLSEADCFGKPVDSICMKDPQKGEPGFCHARNNFFDQQLVTCDCY